MKRQRSEIKKLAIKVRELRKKNISFIKISKQLGISDNYANKILRSLNKGDFDDILDGPDKLNEFIEMVEEEIDRQYTTVLLSIDGQKNLFLMKVLKPETKNIEEYDKQVSKTILEKITWDYFNEGKKLSIEGFI